MCWNVARVECSCAQVQVELGLLWVCQHSHGMTIYVLCMVSALTVEVSVYTSMCLEMCAGVCVEVSAYTCVQKFAQRVQ